MRVKQEVSENYTVIGKLPAEKHRFQRDMVGFEGILGRGGDRLAEIRVCFVCLGNIVRSPLAEALFRQLAEKDGVEDNYSIDSAGTGAWHIGESPDHRMRQVAKRHGLVYDGRSRQFQDDDFEKFDLVFAMDRENRYDLNRLARNPESKAKIHLFREFDPLGGPDASVPDPYYGGIDGFEEVYMLVERTCKGLLQALESGELK